MLRKTINFVVYVCMCAHARVGVFMCVSISDKIFICNACTGIHLNFFDTPCFYVYLNKIIFTVVNNGILASSAVRFRHS